MTSRRASVADLPNIKQLTGDGNPDSENPKSGLFRYQTMYIWDHKSHSRHYKRELIKKFDKEIKAMREKKLRNVDLMMCEADKVLNALGSEDDFVTFSENLYTNAEQAGKIRGITRLQILRGVTKNYVNFKEKHSRNINNDPEILKVVSPERKQKNKFRVKNLGSSSVVAHKKSVIGRTDAQLTKEIPPPAKPKDVDGKGKSSEDFNNPCTTMVPAKNASTNKQYSIYADERGKILNNLDVRARIRGRMIDEILHNMGKLNLIKNAKIVGVIDKLLQEVLAVGGERQLNSVQFEKFPELVYRKFKLQFKNDERERWRRVGASNFNPNKENILKEMINLVEEKLREAALKENKDQFVEDFMKEYNIQHIKKEKITKKKYFELKNRIEPEESQKHFEKLVAMEKERVNRDYLSRQTFSNGFYQQIALKKSQHAGVMAKIQNNVNKICRFQAFFDKKP